MRLFLIPLLILMAINVAVDWYIYRRIPKNKPSTKILKTLQAGSAFLLLAMAIVAISLPLHTGNDRILLAVNWLLFGYLSVYISKYIFIIFDFIGRALGKFSRPIWSVCSFLGCALALFVFAEFWWGSLRTRFQIDVKEITVEVPGLPDSFDGYTLLQFSDFHVGTYGSDTSFVSLVVKSINALQPDAILFTGDIVNRYTPELLPFVKTLSRLKAPDGVKAILGNHDYGDYYSWPSQKAKEQNMQLLYSLFKDMGWKLLLNETDWLVRGSDSIAVIGVENIGDPPFPVYGSLEKAYTDLSDNKTKILLTHNPSHWVDSIAGHNDKNIILTLSGHTHAMQMKFGSWSPSKWRYKTWGGEYQDQGGIHRLYVNIGIGTVGLPMRIGAKPELTLITLRSSGE